MNISYSNRWIALWRLARPLQLVAFGVLYTVGILIAMHDGYSISIVGYGVGLIPLLIAGASIHYSNEYADIETDKMTERTPFSGGSGVLAEGIIFRRTVGQGMWILLMIAVGLSGACVLVSQLTMTAFIILLTGLFFGWMYSLPPLKLGWRGWGELDNAILGGMLLALYGYAVVADFITLETIVMFLPFTGLVFINLLATTWADREADVIVGKNTLATRFNSSQLRALYCSVAMVSYLLLFYLHQTVLPFGVVVGAILMLPIVIWGYHSYTRIHSPHPTVYAMIAMMIAYFVGWLL